MRQAYRIIPVYTADVSGVCSALYELGGMTVMHDPSGCNSTYNTHDEIRWYDQDSLIFISGLSEIDAIMGNDEKLIHDTVKAARDLKPAFIALASSPIPYMNGTDFPALAALLEAETGIPAFAVPTNGMHDYVYGAGMALAEMARRFTGEPGTRRQRRRINILGVTPLDFGPPDQAESLKKAMEAENWQVIAMWAMGSERAALGEAGTADVNLVVSSVGLRAAKVLRERFGTPYVVGTPVGAMTKQLSAAMERAAATGRCEIVSVTQRLQLCGRRQDRVEQDDGPQDSGEQNSVQRDDRQQDRGEQNSVQRDDRQRDHVEQDSGKQNSGKQNSVQQDREQQDGRRQDDGRYGTGKPQTGAAWLTLIGEPVTMGSLAAALEMAYGRRVRVLCPLEEWQGLLVPGDEAVRGEEEIEAKLLNAERIVADPLYRPVCPRNSLFYELPHVAFSGRMYLKKLRQMPGFADLLPELSAERDGELRMRGPAESGTEAQDMEVSDGIE